MPGIGAVTTESGDASAARSTAGAAGVAAPAVPALTSTWNVSPPTFTVNCLGVGGAV
jgi:hypothetical protein